MHRRLAGSSSGVINGTKTILKHVKPNWADAQTAEEVGKLLKSKFPNLEIVGFNDRYNPDIRAAREFAEAIDDMLTKYPQVVLEEVNITKPPPPPGMSYTYAWATPRRAAKGNTGPTTISLNADYATDWPAYIRSVQDELDTGWAFGVPEKPVYTTIIHEFGHAIDFAANEEAHRQTEQVLEEVRQRTAPEVDYRTWVREQLSAYSFLDPNGEDHRVDPSTVEPWEVLAEAFTDAELNGDNARDTSKALHKLMVDSLNTARGE
jgi:hypothetical protein